MKIKYLPFLFIAMSIVSCSQNFYRTTNVQIKSGSAPTHNERVMLAPKIKLDNRFLSTAKETVDFDGSSKCRYQYLYIEQLKSGYQVALKNIAGAKFKCAGAALNLDASKQSDYKVINTPHQLGQNTGIKYYLNDSATHILFETDIYQLMQTHAVFDNYYLDVFKVLSDLENTKSWATSISLEIAKLYLTVTPSPDDFILRKYMEIINKKESFVMVDSKIHLLVDNAEKTRPKIYNNQNETTIKDTEVKSKQKTPDAIRKEDSLSKIQNFWSYNLYGQTMVKLYRDNDGNIMQIPFYQFSLTTDLGTQPENLVGDSSGTTLQASSGDIQLGNLTRTETFIGLYQRTPFKANNEFEPIHVKHDIANDFAANNSQLLFFRDINNIYTDTLNSRAKNTIHSVFGMRNLITPVMSIFINNDQKTVLLNSTIGLLKDQGLIPTRKFKLCRIFNGEYKKVAFADDNTLLEPTDKIIFN